MAGFILAPFWLLREYEPEGGKVLFLGCKSEWDTPDQTPKGLSLIPLTLHLLGRPLALKTSCEWYCHWSGAALTGQAGDSLPPQGEVGTRWLFRSLPGQKVHRPAAAQVVSWLPLDLEDCGSTQRGPGTTGQRGHVSWYILPNTLCFMTVQPWDPSLLRHQGCATSLGEWGPREHSRHFWFSF